MMRERKKKQKADEKRQRRLERKNAPEGSTTLDESFDDESEENEPSAPETENVEE